MTTISAGAAAGLLVALMVVATTDSRGAEVPTPGRTDAQNGLAVPFSLPAQVTRVAAAR